ncbi:MAG: Smr/MutS family protein [Alphaproteobacteria bacterium]|nr:Smr/MutS family protein [Alphaproteobacteria bacterium]
MKHLTESDIEQMINTEFIPNISDTQRSVRRQLHLSTRIPQTDNYIPEHAKLDLHQLTEEQAWNAIMDLAKSGVRNATIITGASGILKIKFQQWAKNSIISPYIISWAPINNGSFAVKFKKQEKLSTC